jgi:nitrate reductase gamma subunit
VARLAGEVLFFRSLFRNTRASLTPVRHLVQQSDRWLWLGAMAFHWSLLIILLRHMRFFAEPTPGFVRALERGDSLFQLAVPALFVTDVVVVAALVYLLGRRLMTPTLRYLSLASDYLALLLLLGIAGSGIAMRYFLKVDLVAAKQLALGLVSLQPTLPGGVSWLLYAHILMVSALFAWFPFSKLMHLGGVFLSPTRNLANDSRRRRHLNPVDAPVEVHTYAQWQAEFEDKLEAAGLPLDGGRA